MNYVLNNQSGILLWWIMISNCEYTTKLLVCDVSIKLRVSIKYNIVSNNQSDIIVWYKYENKCLNKISQFNDIRVE